MNVETLSDEDRLVAAIESLFELRGIKPVTDSYKYTDEDGQCYGCILGMLSIYDTVPAPVLAFGEGDVPGFGPVTHATSSGMEAGWEGWDFSELFFRGDDPARYRFGHAVGKKLRAKLKPPTFAEVTGDP